MREIKTAVTKQQLAELARIAGTLRITPEKCLHLIVTDWMSMSGDPEEDFKAMAFEELTQRRGINPQWKKDWI